jgi:hypothetical protein
MTDSDRFRGIKLYKPVAEKLAQLGVQNFNYLVNQLLAEKLGIDPMVIEAYHREKTDKQEQK